MEQLVLICQKDMKTCSLCSKSSEAEGDSLIYFGEWISKKGITVHYYCLLLSTHLPQRGLDHKGILGFLLRDIRTEIAVAKNRNCKYCFEACATIQCYTCKKYFHLTCGHTSKCLFHFTGDFKSYCHDCVPIDRYRMKLFSRISSKRREFCFICAERLGTCLQRWVYAKCCNNGFTHYKCMKSYALSAGYYLNCIWCKSRQFRENVKYLGIYVPDRESYWEKEKFASVDLYRKERCDMKVCKCPKGRDYTKGFKWELIICKICGAFRAHNPYCIPGFESSKKKLLEFVCNICSVTEQTMFPKKMLRTANEVINSSLYVCKEKTSDGETAMSLSQSLNLGRFVDYNLPQEIMSNGERHSILATLNSINPGRFFENIEITSEVNSLTQSPPICQEISTHESCLQNFRHGDKPDDDDVITNLLVQKMLDIFEI